MVAFEEKRRAKLPSILELSRKGLHDRRFPCARGAKNPKNAAFRICGAIQPEGERSDFRMHVRSQIYTIQRPSSQTFQYSGTRFGMASGLREAFRRVVNSRQCYRTMQNIDSL
jgi:hypothetical protein